MTVPALTHEAPIVVELHPDRGQVSFSSAAQPHDVEQWLSAGGADVLSGVPRLEISLDPSEESRGHFTSLVGLAEALQRRFPKTPIRISAPLSAANAWADRAPNARPDGALERRTLVTTKTLRSGTLVRFDGDVTVIGDVHSGAEVIATGNVTVLGKLSGLAHAGAEGDPECFVFALQLEPAQVRVAQHISILPGGRVPGPEMARVEGGELVARPLAARSQQP